VETNFGAKEAYVMVEKKSLSTDALIAALKKAGYDSSVKSPGMP
jgi:hypothetical protein